MTLTLPLHAQAPAHSARPEPRPQPPHVVAVGASLGGPAALGRFLQTFRDPSAAILAVVHTLKGSAGSLAAMLTRTSGRLVREAIHGHLVEAGDVWLAVGDQHLALRRDAVGRLVCSLNDDPPECFVRPSVDVLFRSAALLLDAQALGVVLTGCGHDGLRGARAIRAGAGRVLVQDEATSVVWGMPGSIVRAGLANEVLPLEALANAARASAQPATKREPLTPAVVPAAAGPGYPTVDTGRASALNALSRILGPVAGEQAWADTCAGAGIDADAPSPQDMWQIADALARREDLASIVGQSLRIKLRTTQALQRKHT